MAISLLVLRWFYSTIHRNAIPMGRHVKSIWGSMNEMKKNSPVPAI